MDGVIVDFPETLSDVNHSIREKCIEWCKITGKHHSDFEGIFSTLEPLDGAIEAVKKLETDFEVYLLSSAPWDNISSWSEKRLWVQNHMPDFNRKHLILSHRKDLNRGSFLIDDRSRNGACDFDKYEGQEWIHFGSNTFPNWSPVLEYLLK